MLASAVNTQKDPRTNTTDDKKTIYEQLAALTLSDVSSKKFDWNPKDEQKAIYQSFLTIKSRTDFTDLDYNLENDNDSDAVTRIVSDEDEDCPAAEAEKDNNTVTAAVSDKKEEHLEATDEPQTELQRSLQRLLHQTPKTPKGASPKKTVSLKPEALSNVVSAKGVTKPLVKDWLGSKYLDLPTSELISEEKIPDETMLQSTVKNSSNLGALVSFPPTESKDSNIRQLLEEHLEQTLYAQDLEVSYTPELRVDDAYKQLSEKEQECDVLNKRIMRISSKLEQLSAKKTKYLADEVNLIVSQAALQQKTQRKISIEDKPAENTKSPSAENQSLLDQIQKRLSLLNQQIEKLLKKHLKLESELEITKAIAEAFKTELNAARDAEERAIRIFQTLNAACFKAHLAYLEKQQGEKFKTRLDGALATGKEYTQVDYSISYRPKNRTLFPPKLTGAEKYHVVFSPDSNTRDVHLLRLGSLTIACHLKWDNLSKSYGSSCPLDHHQFSYYTFEVFSSVSNNCVKGAESAAETFFERPPIKFYLNGESFDFLPSNVIQISVFVPPVQTAAATTKTQSTFQNIDDTTSPTKKDKPVAASQVASTLFSAKKSKKLIFSSCHAEAREKQIKTRSPALKMARIAE